MNVRFSTVSPIGFNYFAVVEHAGSPPRTSVNVAGLEYQGFEPVVSDVNPSDTRAELEDIAVCLFI